MVKKVIYSDLIAGASALQSLGVLLASMIILFNSREPFVKEFLHLSILCSIPMSLVAFRVFSIKKALRIYTPKTAVVIKVLPTPGVFGRGIHFKYIDTDEESVIGVSDLGHIFGIPFDEGDKITILVPKDSTPWYKYKETPLIKEFYV